MPLWVIVAAVVGLWWFTKRGTGSAAAGTTTSTSGADPGGTAGVEMTTFEDPAPAPDILVTWKSDSEEVTGIKTSPPTLEAIVIAAGGTVEPDGQHAFYTGPYTTGQKLWLPGSWPNEVVIQAVGSGPLVRWLGLAGDVVYLPVGTQLYFPVYADRVYNTYIVQSDGSLKVI